MGFSLRAASLWRIDDTVPPCAFALRRSRHRRRLAHGARALRRRPSPYAPGDGNVRRTLGVITDERRGAVWLVDDGERTPPFGYMFLTKGGRTSPAATPSSLTSCGSRASGAAAAFGP